MNDSAVLRDQADARASLRGVQGAAHKHRTDTDGRSNLVKDLALKHCVCLSSAVGDNSTVTELIDCVQSLCLLFVREWSRPGQGSLTERSQTRCSLEFDWTSAAKDALLCASADGFGYPPARLGLAPRFAGLWVVRASIPTPRTNGAQTHVVPFHREVP